MVEMNSRLGGGWRDPATWWTLALGRTGCGGVGSGRRLLDLFGHLVQQGGGGGWRRMEEDGEQPDQSVEKRGPEKETRLTCMHVC